MNTLPRVLRTLLLCAGIACSSCQATRRQPGVSISSAPPGANVILDGLDTGFVTPCDIHITREPHEIRLDLPGYQSVVRNVDGDTRRTIIYYNEAYVNPNTWRFPLWLNYEDGLFPWKREVSYSPARIFVRMRLATED